MKTIVLIPGLLSLGLNSANALPIFSTSPTVTSVDRTATFDSITSRGIDLSNYSEDSLFITVNDISFVTPIPGSTSFTNFTPTEFFYGDGGNNEYVTIKGTDGVSFSAIDFLFGSGQTSATTPTLVWEAYLSGTLVSSGIELGQSYGTTVGWIDNSNSFDEIRVAAYAIPSEIGFGEHQSIALDNVRAQVAAVPVPAAIWLMLSGIAGLAAFKRKKQA